MRPTLDGQAATLRPLPPLPCHATIPHILAARRGGHIGVRMQFDYKGVSLRLLEGDITTFEADVIVNAANSRLAGGSGVDGAIHRAAGPSVLAACQAWISEHHECRAGDAILTTAGNLRAQHIAHAVGPVWQGGYHSEHSLLERAYRRCLDLAAEQGARSILFPSISTGTYGFPIDRAAYIAFNSFTRFVVENPDSPIRSIGLVAHGTDAFAAHAEAFDRVTRTMVGTPSEVKKYDKVHEKT